MLSGIRCTHSIAADGPPLYMAAMESTAEIVRALLNAGADLDERESCGRTPLIYAARLRKHEAMRLQLEHGADARGTRVIVHIRLNAGVYIGGRDRASEFPHNIAKTNFQVRAVIRDPILKTLRPD